ncbi:MAG: hypothetical protein K0S55_887 [Clostridia bacterium]|jgi:hypothetical protein|nr:hypothetical protein [Clostridia bacterium]
MNERQRILKMVSEGTISIEEADILLEALTKNIPSEELKIKDSRGRKNKNLLVDIDAKSDDDTKAKVKIKLPLSLVKALVPVMKSSLPHEAREELNKKGIDIDQIIAATEKLSDELEATEDNIVDIEAGDGNDKATVKIYVD